jgi:hypothetical protein
VQHVKDEPFSRWDMIYALNMAMACLVSYWIMTHALFRLVDQPSDVLGGMWAVVATVFVFRETRERTLSAGISRLDATCVSLTCACSTFRSSRLRQEGWRH